MMNVFVLGTGRCGTVTFIEAAKHIDGFSAGHETLSRRPNPHRLDYPDNHIEADNRLSWMLGALDDRYADEPIYVHLTRDRLETAKSFNKRWEWRHSAIRMFVEGICMTPPESLSEQERLEACLQYVDTVNANIRQFLKDKTRVVEVTLEEIEYGFRKLCKVVGVDPSREAIDQLKVAHNRSRSIPRLAPPSV